MRELGLSYGHRMRVKLKRRTVGQLQTAMHNETGEIDRTVLRLCETGQLSSKVGLYRMLDHNHSAGGQAVHTGHQAAGEAVRAYLCSDRHTARAPRVPQVGGRQPHSRHAVGCDHRPD